MPNFILHNKSSATPICDNSEGSIRGWMYQYLMYLNKKLAHALNENKCSWFMWSALQDY